MFNPFQCASRGLRRPLCSDITSFVRHASSSRTALLSEIQQRRSKVLNTDPMLLVQGQLEQKPIKCWVDASIKHGLIAVVIENKYKIFQTRPQEGGAEQNINWAESVAFELLVHILLAQRFTGSATVYSDSQAALGAFHGLKNRDYLVAASSARLQAQKPLWPFRIHPQWVASKYNVADPFTRGKPVALGYGKPLGSVKLSETLRSFVHQK